VEPSSGKNRLQHTLNNPLAGLLAELQLLEMDDLSDEQRAGVTRAIALCRRVIKIVKDDIPTE